MFPIPINDPIHSDFPIRLSFATTIAEGCAKHCRPTHSGILKSQEELLFPPQSTIPYSMHPLFYPAPLQKGLPRQCGKGTWRALHLMSVVGIAKRPLKNMTRRHATWIATQRNLRIPLFNLKLAISLQASYAVAYVGGCCHPPLANFAFCVPPVLGHDAPRSMSKITFQGDCPPRNITIIP